MKKRLNLIVFMVTVFTCLMFCLVSGLQAQSYIITSIAGTGGSIDPSGEVSVNEGSDQKFTITPDPGYRVSEVIVDNTSLGALTEYTFTNVTSNYYIYVAFQRFYTIVATAATGGSIDPSGNVFVDEGEGYGSQAFIITADQGYHIEEVLVDGSPVDLNPPEVYANQPNVLANDSHIEAMEIDTFYYTFYQVYEDHTIDATFAINTFTITPTVGDNGSISPSDSVTVNYGTDRSFTITSDIGYHISSILIDEEELTGPFISPYTYEFKDIQADHSIYAAFDIDTFKITTTSGTGGSITSNGSVTPSDYVIVSYGYDMTFTITPDPGYRILDVIVDSISQGALTEYTFTNVTDDHIIEAAFQKIYSITAAAGLGGEISPFSNVIVDENSNQKFIITPDTGYRILDIMVDNTSLGTLTQYTFTNVTSDHFIYATFQKVYTVVATAGTGGSIDPSGNVLVDEFNDQTFAITPDPGYHIEEVLVDGSPVDMHPPAIYGSSVEAMETDTFYYTFYQVYEDHTIDATFAIDTFTITPTSGANGVISPSSQVTVNYGNGQKFTITPDTGYHVLSVIIDKDTQVEQNLGSITEYTFTNVESDHTIEATFAIDTFTITPTSANNGSITPSSQVTVNYGDNQKFTITPDQGYRILNVIVDNISQGVLTEYTFTNVTANHTIEATFQKVYTIYASADNNGIIDPYGEQTLDEGADQKFTITPNTGFRVLNVVIDPETPNMQELGSITEYTFTNVTSNHVIYATFKKIYTITATAKTGGSVSPYGDVIVDEICDQKFTIKPDTGYHVLSVVIDKGTQGEQNLGSVTEYTFANITSDHTIEATFAIDTFTMTPTSGNNGSITPSSQVTVDYGDSQKFTITSDTGYHILDVMIDNISQGSVNEYTFTNVTSDHTIEATFAIDTFTITPISGANGGITPSSQVTVDYGDNQKFIIASDTGYHISEVLVDGSSVTIINPNVFDYTFTGVTSNHTISVSFAINDYNITATSGAKGSISPSGSVPISHGDNQKFTMTPDTGYHIVDVMIDNISQGSVTEYTFTNVTSDHTIEATFAIDTFTITPISGANGGITPSSQVTVDYGDNQKFTIAPDTGHHISEVLVDGSSVTVTNPNVFDYTFTGVTSNHTISVSFAINDYTIVSTSGTKGIISPSGSVPISHGGNQKFTMTPDTGYHIVDVMIDNVSQGSIAEYTFTNVQSNHSIEATFTIDTFTITPTSGNNGSITPSSQVTVNYGDNQKFTIVSDTGYHISEVFVDGSSVTVTNPNVFDYTFTGVTSNHTISVSFAINDYTIISTSGTNGSISPSGSVPISHGDNQKFTMTPDTGYHIVDVMIDNVSQGSIAEYTFTNVQSNHSIEATFTIDTFTITPTSGNNGSITPSSQVTVNYGDNQKFTIVSDTGYHISEVFVDGSSVTVTNPNVFDYTFTGVTSNHTISVSFAINDYTIISTSGTNGSISPSGSVPISHGDNQKFIITPDTGYHILDVMVDNVSQGSIAEYTFTNVQSNHSIEATFTIDTFTITPTSGNNGSITPSSQVTVNYGDNQKFTIVSDTGYHISEVFVDGSSVTVTNPNVFDYTFTGVTSNHTISVSFAINDYTIISTSGTNGSISPSGSVPISHGDNQKFTIAPDTGYHIVDVMIDNVSQGSVNEYTFTNVTSDHTIEATFAIDTFTITPISGANGSITPSTQVTVDYGDNQKFTIASDTDYHISEVLVDGSSVTVTNPNVFDYTFTGVTSNHTISVSFAINDYTIISTSGTNGSISPSGSVPVRHGDNQKFIITPDTGYHILDVMVDNVSQGSIAEYTFTNVTSDHTIGATFAIDTFTITPTSGNNGSITPSTQLTVNYGSSQKFTIVSDTGYHISEVLVDGSSVTIINPNVFDYTFTGVTSNHTISASFAINDYTIVSTSGTKGIISPSGSVPISHGDNQKFTIAPDTGYHILDVMVDNVSQGSIAEYTFTNVTSDHTIGATFAIDTFTITPTSGNNGSITPSTQLTVNYGDNQKFTIAPDTGYHISEVLVDGSSVTIINPNVFDYTFTGVTSNHTISASFAINDYTITATSGAKGSISPSGSVPISHGDNQKFTIAPDTGYHIVDVMVDNVSQGSIAEYTFTNVTSDHTIGATFAIDTFTITPTSGNNGSITPSTQLTVNYGSSQKFTIVSDTGHHISEVLVDGSSVTIINPNVFDYTFTNMTSNHTISASFAINDYTIISTSGAKGIISPSGSVPISHGGNQKFTMTPDTGYHIVDVMIDNVSQGSIAEYTFTNVQSNHSIEATFTIDTFTITPTSGNNGSITPSSQVTVDYGDNQKFTIASATGYHILDVMVDNISQGSVTEYTFTNVTSDHTIEATFAIDTFTITPTSGNNGSITPSSQVTVNYGDNQKFTIVSDTGYHISEVFVDGSSVTVTNPNVFDYTFTDVTSNHTISVSFAINDYTITATSGAKGIISPSGSVPISHGGNQKFTITPDTGYHILDVMVDNVSQGSVTEYTFINVQSNHSIEATFAIDTFTITPTSGNNGSITPSSQVTVDYGDNQKFIIASDTGYHISEVLVDGSSVTIINPNVFDYTFTDVTSNHTISVSFAINDYNITATSGAKGIISPSGSVPINHGGNQKFTITPDTGYHILDVMVDNVSQGSVTEYTFINVQSNHSIEATFAIDTFTMTPTSGNNGSITPSSQVTVDYGDSQKFTITSDTGYYISEVLVDGSSVTVTNPNVFDYTFTDVTSNHTISVSFAINDYNITATSGAKGIISPSGSVPISHGDNQKFIITPDTGYHIFDVMVDNVSQGSVTEYTFTNVTSDHTIEATFAIDTFTITPISGVNGGITPSSQVTVDYGDNQKFTIASATGYHISEVLVDGSSVTITDPNCFDYICMSVIANHTISASFAINDYNITATSGAKGIISPSGSVPISHGDNQKFTITPDTGYHILDVMIDNVSQGSVNEYTFTNVTSDHTIEATFAIDTFTITPTSGNNGSITPSSQVTVDYGDNQKFTIASATGYHILDVMVDNISQGSVTEYTFTNVTSDHTIEATFAIDTFTITPTSGNNGSITPSTQLTVNYGDNQKFTITPDTGYHISEVLVDGSSVTVTNPNVFDYTFTGVTSNHTISVSFAINDYTIISTSGTNGSISPSGSVPVRHGDNQKFIITPDTGYHILDVMVDNVSQGSIAEYTFTNVTSDHTIGATFAIDTFTITPTSGNNGSITPSTQLTVNYGSSQKFTIVSDTGYHISEVLVDGSSVTIINPNIFDYTFTGVTSNHTISVSFAINDYTIVSTSGAKGIISPSGSVPISHGDNQKFTITPDTGYYIARVLVDDLPVTVSNKNKYVYTFSSITSSHTISASFKINTYTIDVMANSGGNISPSSDSVDVEYGENVTFLITPLSGYHIQDVIVDGKSVGVVSKYSFRDVDSDHTLRVIFASGTCTIISTTGDNGTINPLGSVNVDYNKDQTFTITPHDGYSIKDVKIDGLSYGAITSYTFFNVTSNHTIETSFISNIHTITANATNGGTVFPSGLVTAINGASQTFTITPADGYHIDDVIVDNQSVGIATKYDFLDVSTDHTIEVIFGPNTYIIKTTVLNGGTIEPAGLITVKNGENLTFAITPDTGYHLAYINLDDTTVDMADSYTITDIKANHKILVGFAANTYDIKATKNDGGTISPAGLTTLNYRASQKFTITPATGYHIEDVKADDQSIGVVTEYDFTNINSNHTIDAIFTANDYTIAATTLNGGTVIPSGSVKAKYGTSQDFTVKPDESYKIAYITVDGVQQTNVSDTYTFTNVTSDHSILVAFEIKAFTIKTKSGTHGLIWPAIIPMSKEMDIPAEYGKTKQFTITADSGYSVTDIKVDGVSLGSLTTYTFSEVKSDHILEATFDIKKFIIKASSGLGGEISPTGSVIVNNGSNQEFTITPEPGYHIVNVTVDSKSVYDDLEYTGETAKFTFTNVEINHEIKAEFGFIITATAETHGSISPNGSLKFVSGEKPKFTIVPEKDYKIVDIIIDGISFFKCLQFTGDEATYTFTALASDHTIHAVFGNTVVASPGSTNPKQNMLFQNYPNPFNAETWIPYQLKEDSEVKISIYNISGELIREFKLGYKSADIYMSPDKAVYWNGKNESGEQVISGTYFYSINAGDFKAVKKFIILK